MQQYTAAVRTKRAPESVALFEGHARRLTPRLLVKNILDTLVDSEKYPG